MELVYTQVLGTCAARLEGSSPSEPTIINFPENYICDVEFLYEIKTCSYFII